MTRVFSGIQPNGELHIGNWLGAVRTWKKMLESRAAQPHSSWDVVPNSQAGTQENLFCIADAHTITLPYDSGELRDRIDRMALDLVACGIDPDRCTLFVQSDVREHTELAWYLGSVAPMDDLASMTQFKENSEGREVVSAAMLAYPVLMSADILLYKASIVPVGEDQLQHVELAGQIARRWNFRYGEMFPEPQPFADAVTIMGLDGQAKMSKLLGNTLAVFESKDFAWSKLKGAYTDPQRLEKTDPGRPDICNIFTMHTLLSTKQTQAEVRVNCTGGKWSCFECKRVLQDGMERELVPLRAKRAELTTDKVRQALGDGAQKARRIARETMREVREVMGIGSLASGAEP